MQRSKLAPDNRAPPRRPAAELCGRVANSSKRWKALAGDLMVLASWLARCLALGYQFLKAAAHDLAARASQLRPWLGAKYPLLKGAADDLGARASRLRLSLTAKYPRLRSMAGDLATRASRLSRVSPTAPYEGPPPARMSVPSSIPSERDHGRMFRRLGIAFAGIGAVCVLASAGAMLWALHDFPLEPRKSEADTPGLLLEAANGEQLGRIGPLKVAEASRQDFPEHLVQAVLSTEDRRFYSHFGIDPEGIIRAMRRNVGAGEVVEGGSTITQQLLKMQFVGNERTFSRKLREALTAVWLEFRLSKDEILTRYLNNIYLGAGAYGMPAAARLYFNKSVKELTLPEAAMLAGLIKAPSLYNPLRDPAMARQRATIVIDAMAASGAIDAQAASAAKAAPADGPLPREASRAGSWFADWVKKDLVDVTGSLTRSIRVRTTLAPGLQKLGEEVVQEVLAREGERSGVTQAALVAMRPDGAVLAMVGGRTYGESQFNRAVEGHRQPGSAFKLFVYLAALRKGFSPNDVIDAGPVEIEGWQPENFDGRTYGRITLAEAFAQSINTAAVRLAMEVGLDEVISAARDLGIEAPLPNVPSIALGSAEVSLLELTGAFASVLAGTRVKPSGVAAVGADDQSPLRPWSPQLGSGQRFGTYREPMIDMLRLVVERGTGRAASLGAFAAGKTGTSQNHRDAWFIGFNESLVVGVWVGNDDGTLMHHVVGGTLPAMIWRRFVGQATGLVGIERAPVTNTGEAALATSAAASRPAQCDYRLCASTYRSFRASDCTYRAYGRGARMFCDMGTSEQLSGSSGSGDPRSEMKDARIARAAEQASQQPVIARGPECNISLCGRFYRSFDASDCTYQPHTGGPRRLCER